MSRNGVLVKKAAGWVSIDRKQEARVLRMGRPLAAFSMMALIGSYHVSHRTREDKGMGANTGR
jgi:hypothetical protein